MKLVVGLGNPGAEYSQTKHNAGFWVIDALERAVDIQQQRQKFNALLMEATYKGCPFVAMKPQTYMNRSGQAVGAFINYYRVALEDVLIILDDVYLPLGQIRIRPSGGAGGHNGLRSIVQVLSSTAIARIRLGIGAPERPDRLSEFVLSGFNRRQQETVVADMVEQAREAALSWICTDVQTAMNIYNTAIRQDRDNGTTRGDKGGNG